MPSIRVYQTPDVADRLDLEVQLDLSEALRLEVASTLKVNFDHVEVLWNTLDLGVNTAPIMIDVLYSVRTGLKPKKKTRLRLAQNLANMTLQFGGMPEDILEVAAWVLPQHDAIFTVAKLE